MGAHPSFFLLPFIFFSFSQLTLSSLSLSLSHSQLSLPLHSPSSLSLSLHVVGRRTTSPEVAERQGYLGRRRVGAGGGDGGNGGGSFGGGWRRWREAGGRARRRGNRRGGSNGGGGCPGGKGRMRRGVSGGWVRSTAVAPSSGRVAVAREAAAMGQPGKKAPPHTVCVTEGGRGREKNVVGEDDGRRVPWGHDAGQGWWASSGLEAYQTTALEGERDSTTCLTGVVGVAMAGRLTGGFTGGEERGGAGGRHACTTPDSNGKRLYPKTPTMGL